MMSLAKSLFRSDTKPPPADAAAKGRFKAKSLMNLEFVREKLAGINREIVAAEADLDRVALTAAISDNASLAFEPISRLQELRARRDMLQRAEVAALAAEQ